MKKLIGLFVVLLCAAQSHAQQITTIELTSLSIPRDRGQDLIDDCKSRINFAIATGKIEGLMANHLRDSDVTAFSIGKEITPSGDYVRKLECHTKKEINVSFREGR